MMNPQGMSITRVANALLVAGVLLFSSCAEKGNVGNAAQQPAPPAITTADSTDRGLLLRRALMAAPLTVARVHVGDEKGGSGAPPGGILRLQARVREDSSDHIARFELAEALRHDHDYAAAEAEYRAAIRLGGAHTASYTGLARLFMTLSRDDEAGNILEKAQEMARQTSELHALIGSIALRHKRYDQGVTAFREAVDLDPSQPRAHFLLVTALERQGAIPSAISALRRGLAHIPESVGLQLKLARLLAEEGEYDEALTHLTALADAHPALTAVTVARSRIHRQSGNLDAAHEVVQAAFEDRSSKVDLMAEFGVVLAEQGQLQLAIPHLERAVLGDPDLLEACAALARAYESTGDPNSAIVNNHADHLRDHLEEVTELKTAIALNRQDAAALFALGDLYSHLVRPVAAAQALEVGLQIVPDNVNALHSLGLVFLGTQRLPRAIDTFEQVLMLDSTSVSAHANLAGAFAASGQVERAIAGFQRALSLDRKYAPAHLGLARIYEKLGQTQEARVSLAEFERFKKQAADDKPAHKH